MSWYIPKDRFIIIVIVLFIMWLGLMGLFYLKADEVTKDPCSVCSKRMGQEIKCYSSGNVPITRTYYPNFTIIDDR